MKTKYPDYKLLEYANLLRVYDEVCDEVEAIAKKSEVKFIITKNALATLDKKNKNNVNGDNVESATAIELYKIFEQEIVDLICQIYDYGSAILRTIPETNWPEKIRNLRENRNR